MSRLENIYKEEVREVSKINRRIRKALPLGSILGVMASFGLVTLVVLVLIGISIDGTLSISKKDIGVDAGVTMKVSLPVENITKVINFNTPKIINSPISNIKIKETTSTTTTTLKIPVITYGNYHDATAGGWYNPSTGVGSRPSGQDGGACTNGGLGR